MGLAMFEVMTGLVMMFLFFVICGIVTKRQTMSYFIVPSLLVWAHVVGKCLQDMQTGPEWMRGHLHDVGVATEVILFGTLLVCYRRKMHLKLYTPSNAPSIMRTVIISHGVGTVVCVAYKVSQVTVFRAQYMTMGYSGELDYGDISMFLLGFALMLTNHFVMRGRVLRKRDMYVSALETRNGLGHT